MNSFCGYGTVRVGNIPESKLRKALAGNAIRLTNAELRGDRVMVVHKLNEKAIKAAQKKGKGLMTHFSEGEANHDLAYHDHAGAGLSGGSLWSWIKGAAKSVYKFAKNNWGALKPIVSTIADAAVPAAATFLGQPELAGVARSSLKSISGVGLKKGSPEMKAKMAALRSKRKTGGSFSGGSFLI